MSEFTKIVNEAIQLCIRERFNYKESLNDDKYYAIWERIKELLPEEHKHLAMELDDELSNICEQEHMQGYRLGFEDGAQCKEGLPIEAFGVKLKLIPNQIADDKPSFRPVVGGLHYLESLSLKKR